MWAALYGTAMHSLCAKRKARGVTLDTEVTPDMGSCTSLEMIGGARIRGKFVIAFVDSNHATFS